MNAQLTRFPTGRLGTGCSRLSKMPNGLIRNKPSRSFPLRQGNHTALQSMSRIVSRLVLRNIRTDGVGVIPNNDEGREV